MGLVKQKPLGRGAGILLPVFSLPSAYGIGTLGDEALRFIDFLKAAGQRYWQVLPLHPTGYADSPYQSFSAFAGNPYFIDLIQLRRDGLLRDSALKALPQTDAGFVDYGALFRTRLKLLRQAFENFDVRREDFIKFCTAQSSWLCDYAYFMAVKDEQGGKSWQAWPQALRSRDKAAEAAARKRLEKETTFYHFLQFLFFEQWAHVKKYANDNGILIIGDLPIYVAPDSADVFAGPSQFLLDGDLRPTLVAGVPPDRFSPTGQLWGNPIYDWAAMEADGFSWWRKRVQAAAQMYDILRIDHFIGLARYYTIPYGAPNAAQGTWREGPAERLFAALCPVLRRARVIAEDLGVVVPAVTRLRERLGYPGMKLLCFAFDSGPDNENLPCHYQQNTVVYGGTHDNQPLKGMFQAQSRKTLAFARAYLRVRQNKQLAAATVRAGYASAADTAIFQMQDLLGLGDEARINFPSTTKGNWRWRMPKNTDLDSLAQELRETMKVYDR